MTQNTIDISYITFLNTLKKRVEATRYQAALKVNQELILLYHHIGKQILKSQTEHGWGTPKLQLCSRLLHNCLGSISPLF